MTGVSAVSYTHLDVYKRQVLLGLFELADDKFDDRLFDFRTRSVFRQFGFDLVFDALSYLGDLERIVEHQQRVVVAVFGAVAGPVSYTHLRKRSLGRSVKYSIAAAIALLIGFGVYQFGRHSGEMVASLQEGTVSKGGSLPALEQAMKADMIANTEPLNDPALEKLFRSVRSVTPVQPTQSAQNPLHRAMVSAGLNVCLLYTSRCV